MHQTRQQVPASAILSIQAEAREVRLASEWMTQFGNNNQVPDAQINRLDLCLNEALANVISHGDTNALTLPVELRMTVEAQNSHGKATVTVSDAGPEFDVAGAPQPLMPQTLADATPGGLGILMIRSFSDELTYKRLNKRNELSFSVHWEIQSN